MHEVLKDDGVKGNLLTYNEMIRACCKQGLTSTSLDVFKDMEKNGVMADELTFNMLIDHLANVAKQVNKCLEFITKMKERGFKPTATTYSHVLDAFGKQGRLFDMMRMLGMCFDCDCGYCCGRHLLFGAYRFTDTMDKENLCCEAIVFSRIIGYLGKLNASQHAELLLQRMKDHKLYVDASVYTAFIELYTRKDDIEKALAMYNEMCIAGLDCGESTYANVIEGCKKVGKNDYVEQLYERMKKAGYTPTQLTYNTVLDMLVKTNQIEKLDTVFEEMKKNGVKPDITTYSTVLNGYGRFKLTDKMADKLKEMETYELTPDIRIYGAVISHMARNNDTVGAEKILAEVEKLGIQEASSYNPIIDAYARNNDMEKALGVRTRMKSVGVKPTVVTYSTLLHTYVRLNQMEKLLECFEEMKVDGVLPSDWTMKPILKALSQHGMKPKAEELKAWAKSVGAMR